MFVDSHCHLDRVDHQHLPEGIKTLLDQAAQRDVSHFLCVCIHLQQFASMLAAIAPFPNVFASCGVHPLDQEQSFDYAQLLNLATDPRVVAIGETGLDYYYAKQTAEQQRESFALHIQCANQLQKPLIIHTRDAHQDTIALLDTHDAQQVGGVFHCFTESWEMAKQGIERGFYISISGIVTFKNARNVREVVKRLPLDKLLIETDSPYLAPVPYRGKQNQPAYVREVAECIAEIKGISLTKLAEHTTNNFFELFQLASAQPQSAPTEV